MPGARYQFYTLVQPDFEYAANSAIYVFCSKELTTSLCHKAVSPAAEASWEGDINTLLKTLQLISIEVHWKLNLAIVLRHCALGSAPPLLAREASKTEPL